MARSEILRQTTPDERATIHRRLRREALAMSAFTACVIAGTAAFGAGFVANRGDGEVMAITGAMTAVMLGVSWLVWRATAGSWAAARGLPERLPVFELSGPLRMGQRPPRTIDGEIFYLLGPWPRDVFGAALVRGEGCVVPRPDGLSGAVVLFGLEPVPAEIEVFD